MESVHLTGERDGLVLTVDSLVLDRGMGDECHDRFPLAKSEV